MVRKGRHRSPGFTLVELLVVVSIIALLIAILLPSLQKAREQAKTVICQSRLRGLSTAGFTYQADFGRYPPSISNYANSTNPDVKARRWDGGIDWLGIGDQSGAFIAGTEFDPMSGNPKGFTAAPKFGKLWPYANNEELYLCPKDQAGTAEPGTILGGGGNGKFSYTQFSMMGLREPELILARLTDDTSGTSRGPRPTPRRLTKRSLSGVPLFVEEHPESTNDRSQSGNSEGNFNFDDHVVARHGPFQKRQGYKPPITTLESFLQGETEIGFADGHVEGVKVNFGFKAQDIRPTSASGRGLKGIPYDSPGLLYYYGIESSEDYVIKIEH